MKHIIRMEVTNEINNHNGNLDIPISGWWN